MILKIINRISLIGSILWTVVLISGLACEIGMRVLIFDDYLSGLFSWMVICVIAYNHTNRKLKVSETKHRLLGE